MPAGSADMGVRFSIVIPAYNEAGYLGEAIRSLLSQSYEGRYEIIVVDNNCTDDTAQIARELGARVVCENNSGVCWARQKGTGVSRGEIVVSADADTVYAPHWLRNIDRSFRSDDRIVAVAGPCRYKDGPLWGRVYARLLFGAVNLVYRATGRTCYATATNIAFRRDCWSGYDVRLTQGGDELAVLRKLRRVGVVAYDNANPTYTSGRRLRRGLTYNLFVTLLVYYLAAYFLNRLCGRPVVGSAPAYRSSQRAALGYLYPAVGVLLGVVLLMPFAQPRHYVLDTSRALLEYVEGAIGWDGR
jgi:glycosyltransferase involved in cell wall biosynthesis